MRRVQSWSILAALILLAGCAGDPRLMTFSRNTTGPNEFLVVPAKPLETPPDGTALPPPVLGGGNRADATPIDDAVVALGGRPQNAAGGIPAGDTALLAAAGRFGTDANIRTTLAVEDIELRRQRRGRPLERLLNVNTYYQAYEDQHLDQQAEIERMRRAGLPVSSAPPVELQPN